MTNQAEDQKQDDQPKRGRQPKQEDQKQDDHLIAMSKNGETIKVHPTCVQAHKRQGWAQE